MDCEPAVLKACGSANSATLDDASAFLGLEMEFTLDAHAYVAGRLVAESLNNAFAAPLGPHTPDLGLEALEFTPTGVDVPAGEDVEVTVELVISRSGVRLDPHKQRDAEEYAKCVTPSTGAAACTGTECFNEASFANKVAAVFYAPGVEPPASGAPTSCPTKGTRSPISLPAVSVRACYPPGAGLEACGVLVECDVRAEYQTNPGRPGTEAIACETLTVCDNDLEREAVAPTATSDRVCVARVTQCDLDSGLVTVSPGSADSAVSCATIQPCDLETSYYAAGPTTFSEPDCVTLSSACHEKGVAAFESTPPGIQNNRMCSSVTAECSSRVATPAAIATFLENPPDVDFYELSQPTPSSDRVCSSATVCLFNETLGAQLTATSDRLCTPLETAPAPPAPPPTVTPSGTPALIYNCAATAVALAAYVYFSYLGT